MYRHTVNTCGLCGLLANQSTLHEAWNVIPLSVPIVPALTELTHHFHAHFQAVIIVRLKRICR